MVARWAAKERISSFGGTFVLPSILVITTLCERPGRGYSKETPAALVYKATWEDEKTVLCTVGTLTRAAGEAGIHKTALIIVGDVVAFCRKEERVQGSERALAFREDAPPPFREDASSASREDAPLAFREDASPVKQEIRRDLQSLSYERSKLYDPSFTTEFRRSQE